MMEAIMPDLRPANSPLSPETSAALDRFLVEAGLGWNPMADRPGREARLAALAALPDGALAAMGLRRADLPRFVYADILGR